MRESNNYGMTRLGAANRTAVRWLILAVVTMHLLYDTGSPEAASSIGSMLTMAAILLWFVTWKSPEIGRAIKATLERFGYEVSD